MLVQNTRTLKASMASRAGGSVVHNQNLNIHYNEASVGRKTDVSKAPRKGGLGGRRPLGDLSNSQKPSVNQTSIFSFPDKGCSASQTAQDASKKKSTSKPSVKSRIAARKPLTDISNSAKPLLNEESKKLNVRPVEPIHPDAIAEERFLHNHQECIKALNRSMDMDEILRIVGLKSDFRKQFATPYADPLPHKVKAESPPRRLELYEMKEDVVENQSWKYPDSPPPRRTPSPEHFMQWEDQDVEFKLMDSPELLKH
ncbi:hypothetical protein Tsubulata_000546 [Turnera subulata]|uniref:Uncharacterized protein n=1 Tax=Turnera subulata TaxID=218843 RepID=A0A9Q0FMI9_9ROSI|nr:hypothetical protein Tsubulata_000546 [Turnera subulata]